MNVRGLMVAGLLVAASGCGVDTITTDCSPGDVQSCACSLNQTGNQECQEDGGWAACVCDFPLDVGADSNGDADASDQVVEDADSGAIDVATDPDALIVTGTCAENLGDGGACTNADDCAEVESWAGELLEISDTCGQECTAEPTCVSACVTEDTGVSGECGDCFAELVTCAVASCLTCSGDECPTCLVENDCDDVFATCAGFDLLAQDVGPGDPEPDMGADVPSDTGTDATDTGTDVTDAGDTETGSSNKWDEAVWDDSVWGP